MLFSKKRALILEIATCLLLTMCIALAISAQALAWWVFDSKDAAKSYEFGLYQFCSEVNDKTTCYKFSRDGMAQLATDLQLSATPDAETEDGRTVWILAFLAIIFLGLSFIISIAVVNQGAHGKEMKTVFLIQSILTLFGGTLGIASVIRAYDFRRDAWLSGGTLLHDKGLAHGKPSTTGTGFQAQAACYTFVWLVFLLNLLLYVGMKRLAKRGFKPSTG